MTELRWTRDVRFVDRSRSFTADGQGVYDVPDDAVDDYLDHRSDGWEEVDGSVDEEDVQDNNNEVVETGGEDDVEDVSTDAAAPPFNPSDYTVDEIEERLADETYDDDALDALHEAEEDGKNRDTALEAVDDARGRGE